MRGLGLQENRWWTKDSEDVCLFVTDIVRRIRTQQGMREEMDLHHARLYANSELEGFGPDSYWRSPMGYEPSTMAWNVVREACDTVQAKLSKVKPLPMFLTTGGNYAQQKRARDLGRFTEGEFERCRVFDLLPSLILDACIFGTGIATVYRDHNAIKFERVFPWELIIDAVEAQYGMPRSIYQRRWVDKWQLIARYAKNNDDLRQKIEASNTDEERHSTRDVTSDLVMVTEAWRLPDEPGGKGRHVFCTNLATLVDEAWTRDYFPFVAIRKNKPVMGFWGTGLAQELAGLQYEVNFVSMRVQKAMRVMGGSMWLLDSGSDVVSSHISNDAGVIVKYRGREPKEWTPQPIHPMVLDYQRELRQGALPTTGVSALSARSEKPSGLTAGIALETMLDAESERFMPFYKSLEEFGCEVARQMIDVGKEIAEDDPNYEVRVVGKRKIRIVKFQDVDLDRDAYVMRVFPTSMLAKTPSARLQQVTDWVNIGWLTPTEGKLLMDFPDLDRVRQLATSSYELVEEIVERLCDGDPEDPDLFVGPEPFMNLQEAMTLVQLSYLRAKLDGVPEPNLELIRRWYQQAKQLLDMANKPAEQAPGAPAPPPPGAAPPPGPPGMPPAGPPGPMQGTEPQAPMGNAA